MPDNVRVGFDEYYEKDYRALVGFARWLGAGSEAEDAVQTAFICLFAAWSKIDNPAAWMRKVVSREVKRNQGKYQTIHLDGFDREADADRAEPDERDRVTRLLSCLPWEERAVQAWEFDGYSIAETSVFEGMSQEAVRNARRRARTTLARLMKGH